MSNSSFGRALEGHLSHKRHLFERIRARVPWDNQDEAFHYQIILMFPINPFNFKHCVHPIHLLPLFCVLFFKTENSINGVNSLESPEFMR